MLVNRQLKRLGLTADRAPTHEEWLAFLDNTRRAYSEADQDRYTLERSLMISSQEMQELYDGLRRSEENFRALVERAPWLVFVYRGDATIIYVNPCMAETLGHETADLVRRATFESIVHSDDRDALERYRERQRRDPTVGAVRLRWKRADGGVAVVESRTAPILFDGEPATVVMGHDVTEKLFGEAELERTLVALRASEERYHTLFDASPLAMMLFDPVTLRILDVNEAALITYGYSRDELTAMTMRELRLPEDVPELVDGMAESGTDIIRVGVRRHRHKSGELLDIEIAAHSLTIDGRRVVMSINRDVTETLALEERLRQSQKMEAVGQLAGGIAHDFNNILAVVLMSCEILQEGLPADSDVRPEVEDIASAGSRASALTRQLLTFSRQQRVEARPVLLNKIIVELEMMLRRLIGENIEVTTRLARSLWKVEADPVQMEQVLLNLLLNARDAMPSGGRIVVETRNIELHDARAAELGLSAGDHVELVVSDTGSGMDPATSRRVFEPFFTTKEVGRGTGMGLATVFGIVSQRAGAIVCESILGEGTTFRAFLPRVTTPSEQPIPSAEPESLPPGSETILLVEDNDQLREIARRVLTRQGYVVLEARTPNAALACVAASPAIDLLLTDVVMPQMNGPALAERITERVPGIGVLFMSGYTDHPSVSGAPPRTTDAFLPKPFNAQELLSAVRKALDGVRSPK